MHQLSAKERKELEKLKGWDLIYIARDLDGGLWAYDYLPKRTEKIWNLNLDDRKSALIDPSLFKFIKWEDDEPHKIEKLLDIKDGDLNEI